MAEVAKHSTAASCWLTISSKVYDVTDFLDGHPGGGKVLLAYGGKDATQDFVMLHRPGILEKLGSHMIVGDVADEDAHSAAAVGRASLKRGLAATSSSQSACRIITRAEVAKHNTTNDCWVIIHDKVYDVTAFLDGHPGGGNVLLTYAGKDATLDFAILHRPGILERLGDRMCIGKLGPPDVVSNGSSNGSSGSVARRLGKLGRRQVAAAGGGSRGEGAISMVEVARHNTRDDAWSVIHGMVYNMTPFLQDHPGGANILLKYAGKDATRAFDMAGHPKDIVMSLGLEDKMTIGKAEFLAAPTAAAAADDDGSRQQQSSSLLSAALTAVPASSSSTGGQTITGYIVQAEQPKKAKPPIDHMLSLFDFEGIAKDCMSKEGWGYYSSGADDEVTMRENHSAFSRIWFRPKILVNVSEIDLSSQILGYETSFPVYITATALGRLAHPDAEECLTRAAYSQGVVQMCPTLASCTLEEMTAAAQPGQAQFFQLYVNHDREVTRRLIERARKGGVKAICVTVDAPQLGRREKDMRNKMTTQSTDVQKDQDGKGEVDRGQGTARAISQFIDPSLCWDDIPWLKDVCGDMKLVLKGVQSASDALKAVEYGLDGVICSNHGGRQLEYARSGLEVLEEVVVALEAHGVRDKLEVWMDGGVRRGSDIIKAIALGAKAVGIGRPTLYGMAAYGQEGAEKVLQILKDEMIMGMRLIGAPSIKDITRDMIITKSLSAHIAPVPTDNLAASVYEPLIASKL